MNCDWSLTFCCSCFSATGGYPLSRQLKILSCVHCACKTCFCQPVGGPSSDMRWNITLSAQCVFCFRFAAFETSFPVGLCGYTHTRGRVQAGSGILLFYGSGTDTTLRERVYNRYTGRLRPFLSGRDCHVCLSICLSVCLLTYLIQQIFVHVACGRDLVLL